MLEFEYTAAAEAVDLTGETYVRINRWTATSPAEPALYVNRTIHAPGHAASFQDSMGNWFEIAAPTLLLTMLGCVGDGTTNDAAAFLGAAHIADTMKRPLGSASGKTYLLGGSSGTAGVTLDVALDLDLNGSTLLAAVGYGVNSDAPYMIIRTDPPVSPAPTFSVVIRNGIIDGGVPTGHVVGTVGDRLLDLRGNDVVVLDRLTFQNSVSKNPDTLVTDPQGIVPTITQLDVLDPDSYAAGIVRITDARRIQMLNCRAQNLWGEHFIITSRDGSTILEVDGHEATAKISTGARASGSAFGVFNVNPASSMRNLTLVDFHNSAVNYLANGGLIENVYIDTVDNSYGIDCTEAAKFYNNNMIIRNVFGKDVDSALVGVSGSNIFIENITSVNCTVAVKVNQTLNDWDDTWAAWADRTPRETSGILIRDVRTDDTTTGITSSGIQIVGYSRSDPAVVFPTHVTVENFNVEPDANPSAQPASGIDCTDCDLTVRGLLASGSDQLVLMKGYAKLKADHAIFNPTSTADCIGMDAVTLADSPEFIDCKRIATLGSGKYDLAFAGSTLNVTTRRCDLVRSPTIDSIELSYFAQSRDYGQPQTFIVPDDDIVQLVPPRKSGILAIGRNLTGSTPGTNDLGLVLYNIGPTPSISEYVAMSDLSVGTSALTSGSSDGVDGQTNLAATAGLLQLKNRQGASATFTVSYLL